MNPLLDILVRDLAAHSTGASALPDAPVAKHVPGRAFTVREQAGAALRALAGVVEPRQNRAVETAHYGRA
jgi:CubicO group peptidase (beta-lactamase class C family)